jgi:hypothetical protein
MINLTLLAGRLTGLNVPSRLTDKTRRCRRRVKPGCRFTAQVSVLEERWLMSRADTPLEMPLAPDGLPGRYDTVNSLSQVLFTGDSQVPVPQNKEITFKNNTKHTVYPFLYDANTGKAMGYGYYDPKDPNNQEFRAYIGYKKGNKDYLGLEPGHKITLWVPLVFWDSGRADIATSDLGFLPKDPETNKNTAITNPFNFYYKNADGANKGNTARYVVPAVSSTDDAGVVMFYHATGDAVNPAADAPAQLIEFTIRDFDVMTAINKINPIPKDQIATLVNYDVSYVDHLLLPVAMAARAVPVPNTNVKEDYGWIGSDQGVDSLQAALKKFTSANSTDNGLGTYFRVDGKDLGWPTFYDPAYTDDDTTAGLKIPGGANLLLSSPLARKVSNYNTNRWMLSSGGNQLINFFGGGTFSTNPDKAILSKGEMEDHTLEAVKPGMSVKVADQVVGTIGSVEKGTRTIYLNLTKAISPGGQSFTFFRPATDPYATKLTNLWYSWAKYYQDLPEFKKFVPKTLEATVQSDTDNKIGDTPSDYRILTFTGPQPELAVGMQVVPQSSGIPPLITIMKIVTQNDGTKKYYLSAPVPGVTDETTMPFRFQAPQPIILNNQATNFGINFDKEPEKKPFAAAFAATVYELMSVFSTATIRDAYLPGSMGIVENVLGGNVGFLPTASPTNYVNISADARDLIKSALRGVPDFATDKTGWYPDPAQGTGNQTWNVFNLDPFVWFVHKRLDLSGYGFSFDDDTADVGATGANDLDVAVGGLDGLTNKHEWKPSTPWGTKQSYASISYDVAGYVGQPVVTLENKTVYNQLSKDDPANGVVGAYVSGNGIPAGTNLKAGANVNQNQFILSTRPPANTRELLTFSGTPPK